MPSPEALARWSVLYDWSEMLIVVLFPCLVDPDKLGNRLLDACWNDNAEKAVQLIEKGE